LKAPREIWPCQPLEEFVLVFDNGEEQVTNTYRVEISRKIWHIHEHYPELPLLPAHHIGVGPLSQERIQDVQSAIMEDVHITFGENGYNREEAWRTGYYSSNRLYNESIVEYGEYICGSNSFDYQEIYDYPPVAAAREEAIEKATKLAIEKAYDTVKLILERDPFLARNPIIMDIRAKTIKMEQLLQIIVVRGFNTDIDGFVYKRPILGNYYAGIHDSAETMMESTLAAKAIIHTGAPLEQTEYGNRKMQFTSAQVDLLIMNDCRSNVLAPIHVTKARLKGMDGLNYVDDKGKLKVLRRWDTALIGETLNFRLPFNCAYRHHNCVCRTCYGELSYNIPYGANIGHIASTMTQSEISQQVLKVKHSEASASADPITIGQEERPYILPGAENNMIRLNPRLATKGIKLLLRAQAKDGVINASKLPIIKRADVKEGMSTQRFSQFRDATFEEPRIEGKQPSRYHVSVSRGTRTAFLSPEFLRFFMNHKFRIKDDGYYHIDLDDWNFDNPVFELPNRHTSMKDFAGEVEAMIRSTRDSSNKHLGRIKQLVGYDDPGEALLDLYELISSKVGVHMTHVSVVMLSMMVSKTRTGDYRIPPLGEPTRFAKYDHVMGGRSMGPFFAYQGGGKLLETLEAYLVENRPPHLLDPSLMPT
jgi:hypothetical protein